MLGLKDGIMLIIILITLSLSIYNRISDTQKKLDVDIDDLLELCDEINSIKFHYNDLGLMDCDKFIEPTGK